jgi:hypothetical protein
MPPDVFLPVEGCLLPFIYREAETKQPAQKTATTKKRIRANFKNYLNQHNNNTTQRHDTILMFFNNKNKIKIKLQKKQNFSKKKYLY